MKMLWLAVPAVFLVMWLMRRSNSSKAKKAS